jgi:hypothetical protein
MNFVSALLAFVLLAATGMWGQSESQTPPPQPPPMQHGMDQHMRHHMDEMKDQVAHMRATLEKMKDNLSHITDPSLHQQAQYDVDLWEDMVHHMEQMSRMMAGHPGMGMHDMHGHGDQNAPPPPPPGKP